MPKFQYKKPSIVEAFQVPPLSEPVGDDFADWCEEVGLWTWTSERNGTIDIYNDDGILTANPTDWIVKGLNGGFYPCADTTFKETYEEIRYT